MSFLFLLEIQVISRNVCLPQIMKPKGFEIIEGRNCSTCSKVQLLFMEKNMLLNPLFLSFLNEILVDGWALRPAQIKKNFLNLNL